MSQVKFHVLQKYRWQALIVTLVFMFIAGPITVLSSVLPDRIANWRWNEILFFFWTRETGVIAAALVGIVTSSDLGYADLLSGVTFVMILSTLLVQASTTPMLAKKLKLTEDEHL